MTLSLLLFLAVVVLLGVIMLLACALFWVTGARAAEREVEVPARPGPHACGGPDRCEVCDDFMAVADAVAEPAGDFYDTDGPTEADREREYIADVLDDTCDDLASFFAAETLGADPMTCQLWMDRAWDRLRELDGDQRIRAVLMLLAADAQEGAKKLSDVEGALR